MSECPHGDDPMLCPPCQQPPTGRRIRRRRTSSAFPARFAGRCVGCGDEIVPGEWLTHDPDAGALVHHGCQQEGAA